MLILKAIGPRNILAKFQAKSLQDKSSMKVIHKILVKFWQKLIFMSIFCQFSSLLHQYMYIGKNNKIQRMFKLKFLKNRMSNLAQI